MGIRLEPERRIDLDPPEVWTPEFPKAGLIRAKTFNHYSPSWRKRESPGNWGSVSPSWAALDAENDVDKDLEIQRIDTSITIQVADAGVGTLPEDNIRQQLQVERVD